MRVVFMGTPEFAVPSLEALAHDNDVIAVYTRPDAVRGRGSKLVGSAVKQAAERLGIATVRQPKTLRDGEEQAFLAELAPDVIVVVAYGLILPPEVLRIPAHGVLNVHGSLLPRWRGAAPIQRAILAGDPWTGVAIMQMEEGLDTGPYCEVRRVEIGELDADALADALSRAGADALRAALPHVETGTCHWTVQDESEVTYAEKISRADVALDPTLTVVDAWRRVRASGPSAPSRLRIADRAVTALRARAAHAEEPVLQPGHVALVADGVGLGLSDGTLVITHLKPDGKGAMAAADWARGARIDASASWVSDL